MYILSTPDDIFPFLIKKEYVGQEPIYFALNNPKEDYTVLCRELTSGEKESDFKRIVYLKDTKTDKAGIGKPCLLLFKVHSIEQADSVVSSYRKGLSALEKMKKKDCG